MTRRVIVKERDVSPRNELTSITSSLRMRCPIDTPLETSTSAQISFEQALDGVKRKDEPSFSASLWVTNVKCQIAIRTLCRFSSSIQFHVQSSEADHIARTEARIFRHQMYLICFPTHLFKVFCRTFLGKTKQHW